MKNLAGNNFLLELARESIKYFLNTGKRLEIPKEKVPENFQKEGAVFVTLTFAGKLRGCIGHLKPFQPIYQDVIHNSINSAFFDPRFLPLSEEEFKKIKIEISILSQLKKLEYENSENLLDFLRKQKPGLVIKRGSREATFLPQVWEELKNPEQFLNHLCFKAGFPADEWRKGNLEIFYYNCLVVSDK